MGKKLAPDIFRVPENYRDGKMSSTPSGVVGDLSYVLRSTGPDSYRGHPRLLRGSTPIGVGIFVG